MNSEVQMHLSWGRACLDDSCQKTVSAYELKSVLKAAELKDQYLKNKYPWMTSRAVLDIFGSSYI